VNQFLIVILCAIIGSGALTAITTWILRRIDQHYNLEQAIAGSATIRQLELEIYRQSLFQPTTSRMQHEHQLDAGREYTRLGGNGPGRVRHRQLIDEYRRRLDSNDWTYPTP